MDQAVRVGLALAPGARAVLAVPGMIAEAHSVAPDDRAPQLPQQIGLTRAAGRTLGDEPDAVLQRSHLFAQRFGERPGDLAASRLRRRAVLGVEAARHHIA